MTEWRVAAVGRVFHTADKILPPPANLYRTAYIASRISSMPCFTKGAADNPTRTPESERSNAISINTRARTNSQSISATEIRSHRTFAVTLIHKETVNAK